MSTLYRGPEEPTPLMEINTTPLIDVMLVLLITLIVTMPLVTHQTKMDLPHGRSNDAREAITLDVDFDGSLYWNGALVGDFETLEKYFRTIADEGAQPDLRLQVDRLAKYDVVAHVLALAQRNGVQRLGFVGQERFSESP